MQENRSKLPFTARIITKYSLGRFLSAKDLESIQRHLSEDCHNLSSSFRDNELVLNLKKGKTECMIFGTAKRLNALNGRQLALTVNGTLINTTSSYKYLGVNLDSSLNLESHFDKMYKRAAGRFNLLRRIRPLIDKSSAEKIYKAMIQPVFTYCGTLGLCWSRSSKSRIESTPAAHIAPPTAERIAEVPKVTGARPKPVAANTNPAMEKEDPETLAMWTFLSCSRSS